MMASPRHMFPKEDILVLLETVSRDTELFSDGEGIKMWNEG